MKKCNCNFCKRDKQFEKVMNKLKKFEFLKKEIIWLYNLYDNLQNIEFELDMLKNKDKINENVRTNNA